MPSFSGVLRRSLPLALTLSVLLQVGVLAAPGAVPQQAARQYGIAEALVERGEYREAESLIRAAVEAYPDSGVFKEGHFTEPYYPHFLLGWIRMELGHPDEALAEFELELEQGAIRLDRQRNRELALRRELAECRLGGTRP